MYFKELYEEIKIWNRIRKIAIENREVLEKSNFRVDWIGRIYTVINLPDEMMDRPDLHEGWVFSQLRDYDSLFMDVGLADYIFPEITGIPDRGAFLLVLTGPKDFIDGWKFVWNLIKLGILGVLARIFYVLIRDNWDYIIGGFNKVWNYIF
jgi:hypothetical protein